MINTLNLFTWYFLGALFGGFGSAMAMFSNLNKETSCTDLLRTSLTVTCFSVWRQFQVGDRSRRRGWCTPRPPRAPPPTPRTWHVAASLELLPMMEKTKLLREDKKENPPSRSASTLSPQDPDRSRSRPSSPQSRSRNSHCRSTRCLNTRFLTRPQVCVAE